MWGFLNYKLNFTASNHPFHIVSSWFILGRLSVSRNLFTSRFPICWYITINSIFLWFFCIPVVSYIISPPSFLISFRSSIFSSWWSWVKLINFIYHFKKPALGFNIFLFYHVSLSELWELVMDREAWHAAIHGITKRRTRLSKWTELNWCFPLFLLFPSFHWFSALFVLLFLIHLAYRLC